jgi:hypothetical protein
VIEDYGNVAFIDGITFAEAPASGAYRTLAGFGPPFIGEKQC